MAIASREITWQRNFEAALEGARGTDTHILLDFSAAPM
jgi:hypothetical protein